MATLMFTAVGQALGGPMGAALGSIIGRSIDESLFGPGPRKGPRIGDLSVQTSSYGSMIPRVYGTMRVAGTVIWSTDLIEEETVEGGGKGSPATQGYKYSVSLAVALSSRPIREVRRIWADGKLVRGADGDLKVRTKFRFATGDDDQPADPMIAAIETIGQTPAYRGVAMAIFENLELGEFGNRVPQLTFEVAADENPVDLVMVAGDLCGGSLGGPGKITVGGYAAHGMTQRDALNILVDVGGLALFDDGERLRALELDAPQVLSADQLGCSAESDGVRLERKRQSGVAAASLALTYYDPERDYQTGQVRVSSGVAGHQDDRFEFPAVVDASAAKSIAERLMARRHRQADGLRLRLPPAMIDLAPGALLSVPQNGVWQVRAVTLEDMAVIADLQRPHLPVPLLAADGGRATSDLDVAIGRTSLALIELPPLGRGGGMFVVGSNVGQWKSLPVEIRVNGAVVSGVSLSRKAYLGRTVTTLPAGVANVFDRTSELEIELFDPTQQLFNADDDALDSGANLALVGRELVQFRQALDLGAGRWRLRCLLRGCFGTEWAMAAHQGEETFCILGRGLSALDDGGWLGGAAISARAGGIADLPPLPTASATFGAEARKPPSPCRLVLAVSGNALCIDWTGRRWEGFGWADAGPATGDEYQIVVSCAGLSSVISTTATSASVPLAEFPGSGPRSVSVSVSALRNGQSSHGATATIQI